MNETKHTLSTAAAFKAPKINEEAFRNRGDGKITRDRGILPVRKQQTGTARSLITSPPYEDSNPWRRNEV